MIEMDCILEDVDIEEIVEALEDSSRYPFFSTLIYSLLIILHIHRFKHQGNFVLIALQVGDQVSFFIGLL